MKKIIFRKNILDRDNNQCKVCGWRATEIHHLKSRKKFPELIYDKNNVISICRGCHIKIEPRSLGYKHTLEARKRISEATKGKKNPAYKNGSRCTKRYCSICKKQLGKKLTKTGKCENCCKLGNKNGKKKRK